MLEKPQRNINIPDLTLAKSTSRTEMAFPLEDERPPRERPPWEPKTRFEMERDMSQVRARDRQIGDSLGWIVDVLLQDEETEDKDRLKKEKREAIESLAYIRDVLISEAMELEEDRLAQAKRQTVIRSAPPIGPFMVPPAPLPVIDSRPKRSGTRQTGSLSTKPVMQTLTTTGIEDPVSSGGSVLAPWNHTHSNFCEITSFPATTANLPRLPPPTSRNLRQTGEQSKNQTTVRGEGGSYGDPLGAMR